MRVVYQSSVPISCERTRRCHFSTETRDTLKLSFRAKTQQNEDMWGGGDEAKAMGIYISYP